MAQMVSGRLFLNVLLRKFTKYSCPAEGNSVLDVPLVNWKQITKFDNHRITVIPTVQMNEAMKLSMLEKVLIKGKPIIMEFLYQYPKGIHLENCTFF